MKKLTLLITLLFATCHAVPAHAYKSFDGRWTLDPSTVRVTEQCSDLEE